MLFDKHIDLTRFNTMAASSVAEHYCRVTSVESLQAALQQARKSNFKVHVLGGGSNVLLPPIVKGLVIHIAIMGRQLTVINDRVAEVRAGAGEPWHELVEYTIEQGYRGLENLSLIPGTAGAAPIQNIGAYGVEIKDTLKEVTVLELSTLSEKTLTRDRLRLSYRDSLFKQQPDQYIVTSITMTLDKLGSLKTSYGDLQARLKDTELTAQAVSTAVIDARQGKLPDYKLLPNAGSFFKNPFVNLLALEEIQQAFPDVVFYPVDDSTVKLAAGWLIDKAGWKGFSNTVVGVHDKQALVLVNHNHGSSEDILKLAGDIQKSVEEQFGVTLEVEPVVV